MKRCFIVILLFLSVVSCIGLDSVDVDGHFVEVHLGLSVADGPVLDCRDRGTEDTKAVSDPEVSESTPIQNVIKNFWVVQYDGISDASRLVGEPKYYPDMEAFLRPSSEGGSDEQVKLVASSGDNMIVIIANTFEPGMSFPQGSTLADLKKKLRVVSDESGFLSSDGSDRVLVFSGTAVGKISEGVSFDCMLKRNVSKINITIVNSSDEVTVDSWQLRSISSVSHYFTAYDLPDVYPGNDGFDTVDYPVVIPDNPLLQDMESDYHVYLPVNKSGVWGGITNEEYKTANAPGRATYLQINATSVSDDMPVIYRFYLGGNMTDDFNILPNVSYSYTFEIRSRGDADYDSRVDDVLLVDYADADDEPANCYMINPMELGGKLRRFRIPVKRVDEFWGGNNGYENVPENTLGADGDWSVEILATNFDNSDGKVTFTKSTGKGSYHKDSSELQYFEFTVKPGTEGSAIVGLRKAGGPVLWSWHLWITDYAPDEAFSHTPVEGVYSYDVPGGVVHRYKGQVWEAEYAGRFMMDRNLGALNVSDYSSGTGSVYYQFGRKDPIFGSGSYGWSSFGTIRHDEIVSAFPDDPTATLKSSVYNPLAYMVTSEWGPWTSGNKYNPDENDDTMLWLDPYTSTKKYFSLASAKSVFDPCPPGYCVPKISVWSDFRSQTEDKPTTNIGPVGYMLRGFEYYDDASNGKGCRYWPYPLTGSADDVPPSPVFYPSSGIIQNIYGSVGNTAIVYVMSANTSGKKNCYMFSTNSAEPNFHRGDIGQNLAAPVRCITSRDAD